MIDHSIILWVTAAYRVSLIKTISSVEVFWYVQLTTGKYILHIIKSCTFNVPIRKQKSLIMLTIKAQNE